MTYAPTQLRMHQIAGLQPGPRLIVLGAVHGNETCGARAIERLVSELDCGAITLLRGVLSLVPVTNPLAYTLGQRSGERNLNRNLRPSTQAVDNEDRLANVLCPLLASHEVMLDLHSFSAGDAPFVMLGPPNNAGTLEPFALAAQEQALALRLGPRRIVEGWLSTYAEGVQDRLARTDSAERAELLSTEPSYGVGTTEYMRSQGGYGVTLECGKHGDPRAVEVAYQAIRNALATLGLVDEPVPDAPSAIEFLRLVRVYDRLHADDRFVRPWSSFDAVTAGTPVAVRHDTTVLRAPSDGHIVFPNASATRGNEWFYFAQHSDRDILGSAAQV